MPRHEHAAQDGASSGGWRRGPHLPHRTRTRLWLHRLGAASSLVKQTGARVRACSKCCGWWEGGQAQRPERGLGGAKSGTRSKEREREFIKSCEKVSHIKSLTSGRESAAVPHRWQFSTKSEKAG